MSKTVRRIIKTAEAPAPGGPYSQGVVVDKTVYISGQIGWDLQGNLPPSLEEQTENCLKNVGAVARGAGEGTDLSNVVKMTVLLQDINDWPKVNEVYKKFFPSNFPARAAYAVKDLPKGAKIEIEAIAIVGEIDDQ